MAIKSMRYAKIAIRIRPLAIALYLTHSLFCMPVSAANANEGQLRQTDIAEIKRLRDNKAWLTALDLIESLSARHPDNNDLYALRVHTLTELGARQKAWQLYRERPQLFSADEAQRIELDRLAALINASTYYAETPMDARTSTAEADAAIDDYLKRNKLDHDTLPPRLRNDRILLLNETKRYRDVVAEYERMRGTGQPVPGYVAAEVADSLMALRRPDDALNLTRIATEADPTNANWGIQQAYAFSESEQFTPALHALDRHVAANAPWLRTANARQPYPNWKRYDTELNRTLIASYAEDLPGAQQSLETMLAEAPNNSALHVAIGGVYARRGWQERALEQYRIATTLDPRSTSARIGQAESLIALRQDDLASPLLAVLNHDDPDSAQVQQANREWALHRGWQWQVETESSASSGNGSQSPLGARDARHAFAIESPLIDDRWRVSAAAFDSSAEFGGSTIHDRRNQVGVHYAYDRLDWRAAVNRSVDALDSTGLSLDLGWRFNDTLSGSISARRHDPEASLQARAAGIQADSLAASLAWSRNERSTLSVGAQNSHYDDGNRRASATLRYDHRLLTRPHLFLNGSASLYTSRNSRDDAPYFNPSRDGSVDYTLSIDHLAWRRYERHFRHRLSIGVGQYWQADFGSAWIPTLQYEHEWRFALGRTLNYGLRWSQPVYDGNREQHFGLYGRFSWGE